MVSFEYITARGDVLNLTKSDYFTLTHIDAQTSAAASIASAVVGTSDGDNVNSIRVNPRTIILDLRLKGNIEQSKREILKYVKIKQKCTIKWTQNDRTVTIDGFIESIDMPRWDNGVTMQIYIHCSVPFWKDIDFTISKISEMIDMHYFTDYPNDQLYFTEAGIALGAYDILRTRTFTNYGDVSAGIEIEILAFETVTNPIITNENGEFFGVGEGNGTRKVILQSGDVIKINTGKNAKSVTLNGVSLLSKIKSRSTWLQMEAGENVFTINSNEQSTSNMTFTMKYKQMYI